MSTVTAQRVVVRFKQALSRTSGDMQFSLSEGGEDKLRDVMHILRDWSTPLPITKMVARAMRDRNPLGLPDGDLVFSLELPEPPWADEADFLETVDPHRQQAIFSKYRVDSFDELVSKILAERSKLLSSAKKSFADVKHIAEKSELVGGDRGTTLAFHVPVKPFVKRVA